MNNYISVFNPDGTTKTIARYRHDKQKQKDLYIQNIVYTIMYTILAITFLYITFTTL